MEPDWLKTYKKRQKERRESQEKREAIAVQQSIDSAAYGRPIAPKLSGGACTVALPSGSGSAVEQGTVTWVAIASGTSPWKAVTAPQTVGVVGEVENACTLTAGNVTSARSSPVSRYVTVGHLITFTPRIHM